MYTIGSSCFMDVQRVQLLYDFLLSYSEFIYLFCYIFENTVFIQSFLSGKTEAKDYTSKSAVSLGQVVVCPLAFHKQDTVLFDFFLFLRYPKNLIGFCFTFWKFFFFKFPFYRFIFSSSSRAKVILKRDREMLKVCHTFLFSFRARRSFEPSHGTLHIGIPSFVLKLGHYNELHVVFYFRVRHT